MRTWQRTAFAVAVCCGVAASVELAARLFYSRSVLANVLPSPPAERVVLCGSAASGTVLDGHGGWFNEGKVTEFIIRSEKRGDAWDRPSDIVICNGRLRGSIRIMGMGRNGQAREVRLSSYREGHTARAQAAAPTRILIRNVEFVVERRIPLYLAPGVTCVTVEACRFTGRSGSVAVYLDAESGGNVIRNNTFDVRVGREVVAVDGSAGNCIDGNRFERHPLGGIYLYRNCGEGGTVRHQTPHGNLIAGNRFAAGSLGWGSYAVWLGSRNGQRVYCEADAGHPFGSSVDNRDFADNNTLTNNTFRCTASRALRNDGEHNQIAF